MDRSQPAAKKKAEPKPRLKRFALGECAMVNNGVPYLADRVPFTAVGAELVDQIMMNVKQPQLAQGSAAAAGAMQ